MKKKWIYVLILTILLETLAGCAGVDGGNMPTETDLITETGESAVNEPESDDMPVANKAQDDKSYDDQITGISIDFEYARGSGMASNQIALWIEDGDGTVIKTIYVTDFTAARRGYKNREDSLSHWVEAVGSERIENGETDAVSSATPQTGEQHYVWDLTDDKGQKVPAGLYTIKLEGTLFWSSNVIYTGVINTAGTNEGAIDVRAERSEPDNTDNENMIQNVRISVMTGNTSATNNTAEWLGGLTPEAALEYMKEHYDEGLVIVEVNTDYWKLENAFTGAMHIPHDQMAERYNEIPSGVPVILHCGAGVVSVPAYETLLEKRKDIPQLSYIAGHPPVEEFNEWLEGRNKESQNE